MDDSQKVDYLQSKWRPLKPNLHNCNAGVRRSKPPSEIFQRNPITPINS